MRKESMPSGAVLTINPAPFADAKNLYQAVLQEFKTITLSGEKQHMDIWKDIFCIGLSSPLIDHHLWKCMERCQYNYKGSGDLRISADLFEKVECREDYMKVSMEVLKENVGPFMKSLWQEYKIGVKIFEDYQK